MLDKAWIVYADQYPKMDDPTVQDVVDSMNEAQKMVLYALVGQALREAEENAKHGKVWRNVYGRASYLLTCIKAWWWHRNSGDQRVVYGR